MAEYKTLMDALHAALAGVTEDRSIGSPQLRGLIMKSTGAPFEEVKNFLQSTAKVWPGFRKGPDSYMDGRGRMCHPWHWWGVDSDGVVIARDAVPEGVSPTRQNMAKLDEILAILHRLETGQSEPTSLHGAAMVDELNETRRLRDEWKRCAKERQEIIDELQQQIAELKEAND